MRLQGLASQISKTSALDEQVIRQCQSARDLEWAGEYEGARAELSDRWHGVGQRPKIEDLGEVAQTEVLLRAGTLSGFIGNAQQIDGAQEFAKDLISESARRFEQLGLYERWADAQVDLAICYWRAGALDETRITLSEVLSRTEQKSEARLRALANLALLERVAGRFKEALQIQLQSAHLFEESANHILRGNFHNVFAQVLKEQGVAEHREDYIDRALVEYAAASFHFEQAGNVRFQGRIENNLASLFAELGRYKEAHDHLNHARSLFVRLRDRGMVAHVDETCAKALLAEGRNAEALTSVAGSVRVFEEGDERSALVEALTTQAIAQARVEKPNDALAGFRRAIHMAEVAGDPSAGGLAALAAVEELSSWIPWSEIYALYRLAESLLQMSQNPRVQIRLGECARKLLATDNQRLLETESDGSESRPVAEGIPRPRRYIEKATHSDSTFAAAAETDPALPCSLEEEVLRYEGNLIKRALESSGGSVTRAARLLGTTHQGLAFILNGRQRSLMSARKPVRPRRKSIIRYH